MTIICGHRCLRGNDCPPENTIVALSQASLAGVDQVEIDVRLCASGEVVVFHDPTLSRMTNGVDNRAIADLSYEELRHVTCDINGYSCHIPSLFHFIDCAEEYGIGLNIEIKSDVPNRLKLVKAVAREIDTFIPIIVSSFDPFILAAMAALSPKTQRGLITEPGSILHRFAYPPFVNAIHLERTQATIQLIERCKKRGLKVAVWVVNDPMEAQYFATLGVDTIITDEPWLLCKHA